MLAPRRLVGDTTANLESAATRVADLLFADVSVRPSPQFIAGLLSEGVDEPTLLTAGAQYGLDPPVMDVMLQELDLSLPYYQMMSDRLAQDFPTSTVLFAGRDAEVLYDDFAIAHADHPSHLMPASLGLWSSSGMRDTRLATCFLDRFGLSSVQVSDRSNTFVVVDGGFRGTIAGKLDATLERYYAVSLLGAGRMVIKLVSASSEFPERQIIPLDDITEFPPLPRASALSKRFSNKAHWLATEMQVMPRYHGMYHNLEERDGRVVARSFPQPYMQQIDRVQGLNTSVVNPLAAAISQFRVVKAAMQRDVGKT